MASPRARPALRAVWVSITAVIVATGTWTLARRPVAEWWARRRMQRWSDAPASDQTPPPWNEIEYLARHGSIESVPATLKLLLDVTSDFEAIEFASRAERIRQGFLRHGAALAPMLMEHIQHRVAMEVITPMLISLGPLALPALEDYITTTDSESVGGHVAQVLRALGPDAAPLWGALQRCLVQADVDSRPAILLTMAFIQSPSDSIVEGFRDLIAPPGPCPWDRVSEDAFAALTSLEPIQTARSAALVFECMGFQSTEQQRWPPTDRLDDEHLWRVLRQDKTRGIPFWIETMLRCSDPVAMSAQIARALERLSSAERSLAQQAFARVLRDERIRHKRVGTLRFLPVIRPIDDVVLDAVLSLLRDESPDLRFEAALALGRLSQAPERCLPELVGLLDTDLIELRLAAVEAIGLFRSEASSVLKSLENILREAVRDNLRPLEHWDEERLVAVAAVAMARVCPEPDQTRIAELLEELLRTCPELRVTLAAAKGLLTLGDSARPAADTLRLMLSRADPLLRLRASLALAGLGEDAPSEAAMAELIQASFGGNEEFVAALDDLELASERVGATRKCLELCLRHDDVWISSITFDALLTRPRLLAASKEHWVRALDHADPDTRASALRALVALGPLGAPLRARTSGWIGDRGPTPGMDSDGLSSSSFAAPYNLQAAALDALVETSRRLPVGEARWILTDLIREKSMDLGEPEVGGDHWLDAIEILETIATKDPALVATLKSAYKATQNDDLRLAIVRLLRQIDPR